MRVIITNGLARKPPWGSSKMTAMPPRQGAWLASCVDEPGVQLSKGKKIMEGMSLSQPEPRTSWDDDEDAEHEHGKRRGEERWLAKLQAALRWSRDTEVVVS
jgi:hypothetical protein